MARFCETFAFTLTLTLTLTLDREVKNSWRVFVKRRSSAEGGVGSSGPAGQSGSRPLQLRVDAVAGLVELGEFQGLEINWRGRDVTSVRPLSSYDPILDPSGLLSMRSLANKLRLR